MEIYVTISFITIFSFLVLKHDFIRCLDFNIIAALNTTSDTVTNSVIHRILNTNLLYYCAHFVVEIG